MNHCIYKGKVGVYIMTNKVLLFYHNNAWSTFTDPTQMEWIMVDLANAQRIENLEFLVLTGISSQELEKRIKEAENGYQTQGV